MKKIFPSILFLCFYINAFAQELKAVKIEKLQAYIKGANHPLIINFWATWCKPCIAEIPHLQQAARQYKDSGLELIMVSLDFPEAFPKDITAFIKGKNLVGTFFWLDETDADHFCPVIDKTWQGSIPATLFLNVKKDFRKFYGQEITPEALNAALQEMLQ
jgi:thiol-disulfide isomerase/thioredoxin